jgi:hypothetical protein
VSILNSTADYYDSLALVHGGKACDLASSACLSRAVSSAQHSNQANCVAGQGEPCATLCTTSARVQASLTVRFKVAAMHIACLFPSDERKSAVQPTVNPKYSTMATRNVHATRNTQHAIPRNVHATRNTHRKRTRTRACGAELCHCVPRHACSTWQRADVRAKKGLLVCSLLLQPLLFALQAAGAL